MLSWSSTHAGDTVELDAVAEGRAEATALGLEHGVELLAFASACAGTDAAALAAARTALATAADEAFMVDAAAVAANFEMMTRLADGTGARFPTAVVEERAPVAAAMGAAAFTSRR